MSRSKWKGVYIEKDFLNSFLKEVATNNSVIFDESEVKLFSYKKNLRNSTIIAAFVGYEFTVFNGIKYHSVIVNENMVGFKFGDFSLINLVSQYAGRARSAIRKYKRAVRKVAKTRERRERRVQKMLEKDD